MKGGNSNMEKTISLFFMALLLVGTFGFVAAEETEDVVPEAKKVGFFEDRMDRWRFSWTFDKEKKIERALEMAEKRLAEAEVLADEDPEAYERAQERYDELVKRAEEILADIESDAGDENESEEYIGKIARIQNKFERHRDHIDEIYTRARERFEMNNASEEKLERFERFHERALNRTYEMEDRALEKRENAVRKHKALSEMSDEELEDLLEDIEDGEGLTQAREKRFERYEMRLEHLEERGELRIEHARERLEGSDLTEEQKERLRIRIREAEDHLNGSGEKIRQRIEIRKEFEDGKLERIREKIEYRDDLDDDDSDDSDDDSDDSTA